VSGVSTLLYDSTSSGIKAVKHLWHTGYYRNRQKTDSTGVTNILWFDGYTMAKTSAAAQFNAYDSVVVVLPEDNVVSCVSPIPIATIKNVSCEGAGSISLKTLGGPGPFTYAWQGPKGFKSYDQDITASSGGIYKVTVTAQGGCSTTASYTVTDSCKIPVTGLSAQVSPNPAATQFDLTIQSNSTEKIVIDVINIYGKKVYYASGGADTKYTFGKGFPSGVYFVKVMQGKETQTLRLIKEK
jgi:hypothetical protein